MRETVGRWVHLSYTSREVEHSDRLMRLTLSENSCWMRGSITLRGVVANAARSALPSRVGVAAPATRLSLPATTC